MNEGDEAPAELKALIDEDPFEHLPTTDDEPDS
jgi:hypothetical protein